MCNKEIVICAAIWVQDGKKRPYQPTNIPSGTVFCGLRHPSILSQLAAYGIAHKNRSVQGFLTSKSLGRGLANQIKINKTIPVSHKPKEERRMMFVCGDDIASLIKRFENESK